MILKRYSKNPTANRLIVDRNYSGTISPFSRNSHAAIKTPRVFCYALNSDVETIVTTGRTQYLLSVADDKIVPIDLGAVTSMEALREQIAAIANAKNLAGYSYSVHGLDIVCLTRGSYDLQSV